MSEPSRSDGARGAGEPEDGSNRPQDVSRQALSIARALDRLCLPPDDYELRIQIPAHSRHPWEFELSRLDTLRRTQTRAPTD